MKKYLNILLFVFSLGFLFSKEHILNYNVELELNKDGSLFIIENIIVKAEGNKIQRGIMREFPTKYKDQYGNNININFEIIDILKDGLKEPYFLKNKSNGKIIYVGHKNIFLKHQNYTYTLKYNINRQVGFFENYDELYYNVIGTGWSFPIEKANIKLSIPENAEIIQYTAYTGSIKSKGKNFKATLLTPNVIQFENLYPFNQYEGLTIAVSFPKGIIKEPAMIQKINYFLSDNAAILIFLVGYLFLLLYYLFAWNKVGRDPDKGTIIPHYSPPNNFSPAALRYILSMNFDRRCFSAAIVNMARKGFLDITNDENYKLTKKNGNDSLLSKGEKELAKKLFLTNDSITLDNKENVRFRKAINGLKKALKNELNTHYFNANGKWVFPGIIISLIVFVFMLLLMEALTFTILASFLIIILTNFLFIYLMQAPTLQGRKIMDQIEGFKLYLSVAESDRLNLINPPKKTPELFEKFLPYAIALKVENKWGDQFNSIFSKLDEENNSYQPYWYHSHHSSKFTVNDFTSSIGKSFSSAISSAATPPGGSSASGGGGFSGGGGGGGGGGGW